MAISVPALANGATVSHNNWNQSDCSAYEYSWGTVNTCWTDQAVFQYVTTPSGITHYRYSMETLWNTTYNYNDGRQDVHEYHVSNKQSFLIKDGEQHIFRVDEKLDQYIDRDQVCVFFERERAFRVVNGAVQVDTLIQNAGDCS